LVNASCVSIIRVFSGINDFGSARITNRGHFYKKILGVRLDKRV
jgi:hypothetical protein